MNFQPLKNILSKLSILQTKYTIAVWSRSINGYSCVADDKKIIGCKNEGNYIIFLKQHLLTRKKSFVYTSKDHTEISEKVKNQIIDNWINNKKPDFSNFESCTKVYKNLYTIIEKR